jgi:hypothetical protein
MSREIRPGDYRICPSCGARHKVQDLRCAQCQAVLAGTPVLHATPVTIRPAGSVRSARGLRAVLAVGLVVALGAGFLVWNLFRGAHLQQTVEAATPAASATAAPPEFTPPVLNYPPVVGYNTGVPASMVGLTIQNPPASSSAMQASLLPASASTDATGASTGMTSVAPPAQPTHKTAFTNDDLEHMRSEGAPAPAIAATGVAPAIGRSSAAVPPPATVAPGAADQENGKWLSRIRDREDEVQSAQAKVRRLQADAEAKRTRALAVASDPDAQDKAQRDVSDALDELDKAERKLSDKQRELDETKTQAQAAGVRFER